MATDLDCQISAISSLADRCSVTAVPACLTATGADVGSDCCGSIYSWGTSVAECYLANAPDCLGTAAASDYVSDFEDLCAAYTTGLAAPTDTSGATATTGGGSSATATSTGSSTGAAPKVGAGLKVYLAIALAGAMAGLSL